jgi:hypothetical protein
VTDVTTPLIEKQINCQEAISDKIACEPGTAHRGEGAQQEDLAGG